MRTKVQTLTITGGSVVTIELIDLLALLEGTAFAALHNCDDDPSREDVTAAVQKAMGEMGGGDVAAKSELARLYSVHCEVMAAACDD
jgi:hypothetical protein